MLPETYLGSLSVVRIRAKVWNGHFSDHWNIQVLGMGRRKVIKQGLAETDKQVKNNFQNVLAEKSAYVRYSYSTSQEVGKILTWLIGIVIIANLITHADLVYIS